MPAAFLMLVIFILSSQPSSALPDFATWDLILKKSAHVVGYGLLARAYLHLLGNASTRKWLAWCMAIGYAVTDEFHQSFVPGRSASVFDVMIFDNLGAGLALWLGRSRG